MEISKLSPERWCQIAVALFDRYVTKRMIEPNFVVTEEGINDQDLRNLAFIMNCEPSLLRAAIINTCSRICKNQLNIPISHDNEIVIMKAAVKLYLKELPVSLMNFKREFGKIIHELNRANIGLYVSVEEFKFFILPLHVEVITEFYSLN